MSQNQDIKYIAPETKQAMVEFATEKLMGVLRELPGGELLSDKKIDEFSQNCSGRLNKAKTFEEMQEMVNDYLAKIKTIAENADTRNLRWKEIEGKIESVKSEVGGKFTEVIELIEKTNKQVELTMQEAAEKIESVGKENRSMNFDVSPFEDSKVDAKMNEPLVVDGPNSEFDLELMERFASAPNPLEIEPFAETADSVIKNDSFDIENKSEGEGIVPENVEKEEKEPQIIERDGQKYVMTKEAEYDENGELISQGELRTLGACDPTEMKKGQVTINNGTFNMILTLDEYKEMILSMEHSQSKPQNRNMEEMDK